ncbi:hypothetical protein [Corynebacterium ulceribovis]|uniref:hypothetical protein n=1 Tax=Corynebacterium ulceribovis TaxID=487732 RepID=UPI0012EA4845|nr:hypothetical protein [Corynebacterium ulceribovis]
MTKSTDLTRLNHNDLSWFYLNLCPDEISKLQALIKHPRSLERRSHSWRPPSYFLMLPHDDGWAGCEVIVRKTKLSASFAKHAKRYFPEYARLGGRNLYLATASIEFRPDIGPTTPTNDWQALAERALSLVETAVGPLEAPHVQLNPYSSVGTTVVVNWFCDSTGTAYPDYDNALVRVQQAYHAVA